MGRQQAEAEEKVDTSGQGSEKIVYDRSFSGAFDPVRGEDYRTSVENFRWPGKVKHNESMLFGGGGGHRLEGRMSLRDGKKG